jgi:hypothetical protein
VIEATMDGKFWKVVRTDEALLELQKKVRSRSLREREREGREIDATEQLNCLEF